MQSRLLILFHMLVILVSLWISKDLALSVRNDFLGINAVALWLNLAMVALSVIAVVALHKRMNWAAGYASTLAVLYLAMIAISSAAYLT